MAWLLLVPWLKSVTSVEHETLISHCLRASRGMPCGATNNVFNQQLHELTGSLEMRRRGKDGRNYQAMVKHQKLKRLPLSLEYELMGLPDITSVPHIGIHH